MIKFANKIYFLPNGKNINLLNLKVSTLEVISIQASKVNE